MTEAITEDPFAPPALPPADHNNPPEVILRTGKELDDYLETTYGAEVARAIAVIERGKDFLHITTDQQLEDATEYMVKCRAAWKVLESARVKEKGPYDEFAGVIHAYFKKWTDGLALPASIKGRFEPRDEEGFGIGVRVNMAMTIYADDKAQAERRAREAEAARLRQIEAEAQRKRDLEAQQARAEEFRRQEAVREAQRKADQERRDAELAASRARSEETRKAREAEAEAARQRAAEAQRLREEEERRLTAEREVREADDRAEAERLAQQRSDAEESAAATTADLSRVRGHRGGVASLKENYSFRDLDRDSLDLEMLRPYFADTDLDKAVRAYIKANQATVKTAVRTREQPMKGVVFCLETKMASRA